MNPILISPKIETDQPAGEQLRQMRSYLFQFKEQMEFLLMNIDGDNISEAYKNELSTKFADATSMSEIMQTAGMIKMTVQDVENAMASLTLTVNSINLEVNAPGTGLAARLTVAETGVAASVKRGVAYSGFTISDNLVHIFSTGNLQIDAGNFTIDNQGNVSMKGRVSAEKGSIGYMIIKNGALYGADPLSGDVKIIQFDDSPDYGSSAIHIGNNDSSVQIYGNPVRIRSNLSVEKDAQFSKEAVFLDAVFFNDQVTYNDGSHNAIMTWKDIDTVIGTGEYVLCGGT